MHPPPAAAARSLAGLAVLVLVGALRCAGSGAGPAGPPGLRASSPSLEASSGVACQVDSDCEVCHRAASCGEPIAAADPQLQTDACHVPPPAFCLPRRSHCDQGRCTAR